MDSQWRSRYESLSTKDWVELGYLPKPEPGLTGNIHDIFQRTNTSRPPIVQHIWPQFKSQDEYDAMFAELGTVLQMASNILATPASLEFIYQVAFSSRQERGGLTYQGHTCREFGHQAIGFPALARQEARKALRGLSHSITLQIADPVSNPEVVPAFAVTSSTLVYFMEGVRLTDVGKETGLASRITLNEAYILKLRELDAQEGDTTSQKMSLQLKMAITLCHEITHAVTFAVDQELLRMAKNEILTARQNDNYKMRAIGTEEPFYKSETMAEIGSSWENQVFGGKVFWSGNTNDPLFVSKWPTFLDTDDYVPRRGTEKRTARKYAVPMHFIKNMHRQSFWDRVGPSGDTTALLIKKTIGIEYVNPDTEAVSVNSSETKWPKDQNSGRVSREQEGRPVADPSSLRANETADERLARELASEPSV